MIPDDEVVDDYLKEFLNMDDTLDEEFDKEEIFPIKGVRYKLKGLKNRDQYVVVDDLGITVTFPDNKNAHWNYQATATALTRVISIAMQAGVAMDGIKKQLRESSMQKHDTPDILLTAIEKYERGDRS